MQGDRVVDGGSASGVRERFGNDLTVFNADGKLMINVFAAGTLRGQDNIFSGHRLAIGGGV